MSEIAANVPSGADLRIAPNRFFVLMAGICIAVAFIGFSPT